MITVKINGIKSTVPKGTTIINIARINCFNIPTLCNQPISSIDANCNNDRCGVCVVEVEEDGVIKLVNSCCTEARNNMIIKTLTREVTEERARRVKLLNKW